MATVLRWGFPFHPTVSMPSHAIVMGHRFFSIISSFPVLSSSASFAQGAFKQRRVNRGANSLPRRVEHSPFHSMLSSARSDCTTTTEADGIALETKECNTQLPNRASITHRSQGRTHLDDIEDAVTSCLSHYSQQQQQQQQQQQTSSALISELPMNAPMNILNYPQHERESIGVASNLKQRLDSFARSGVHCRRCWLQRRHCVCGTCIPLETGDGQIDAGIPHVKRLFLLTHHKEICLAVDTAKLIVAAFPRTAKLVAAGIPREFQPVLGEMLDIVSKAEASSARDILEGRGEKCLILFPTEDATTLEDILRSVCDALGERREDSVVGSTSMNTIEQGWNVVVLDGTWSQARKIHARYFPQGSCGMLFRVQLSSDVVNRLNGSSREDNSHVDNADDEEESGDVKGFQLRRHPIKWREISTLEATRLLLLDMHPGGQFDIQAQAMSDYQEQCNEAVKRQLGPPRHKCCCAMQSIDKEKGRSHCIARSRSHKKAGREIKSVGHCRCTQSRQQSIRCQNDLIKALSDEIKLIASTIILFCIDEELQRTITSKSQYVTVTSIRGFDTTVKTENAIRALELEHKRFITMALATETIERIFEWYVN
ncbi:hypothetical protein ACHAW6_011811 [Cyclotella cf. meneghiniana]